MNKENILKLKLARIITDLVRHDWPQNWPELMEVITIKVSPISEIVTN